MRPHFSLFFRNPFYLFPLCNLVTSSNCFIRGYRCFSLNAAGFVYTIYTHCLIPGQTAVVKYCAFSLFPLVQKKNNTAAPILFHVLIPIYKISDLAVKKRRTGCTVEIIKLANSFFTILFKAQNKNCWYAVQSRYWIDTLSRIGLRFQTVSLNLGESNKSNFICYKRCWPNDHMNNKSVTCLENWGSLFYLTGMYKVSTDRNLILCSVYHKLLHTVQYLINFSFLKIWFYLFHSSI